MAKKASTAVALTDEAIDFFAAYGKQASKGSNIVGDLLRFNKGEWLAGQDEEELKLGTKLVFNMTSLLTGWQRWEDKKPAEQAMGLLIEGFQPVKRDELGFTDKEEWEEDNDGKKMDPWQFSNQLIARGTDKKAQVYTVVASSKGAIGAIGKLCTDYSAGARANGGKHPIVTLGRNSYKHPTYGKVWVPEFEIVGWAAADTFDNMPEASEDDAPKTSSRTKKPAASTKKLTTRKVA